MSRLAVKIPTPSSSLSPAWTAQVEEAEPLSPIARIFRQPGINCHIVGILGFGKVLGADEVKAALGVTLIRHPRFSSVQVADKSGQLQWVRTLVNLDNHVVFPDLDPAAAVAASIDPSAGDRFVEDFISDLCGHPLDPSRPLWDLHLLAIRTTEAAVVAVFRIHHSLGDCLSLISLLLSCTHRTSDPDLLPSLPETRRRQSSTSAPWKLLSRLYTFLAYIWNTIVNFLIFFLPALFVKDTQTPIMGTEGVEYRPKRFVHRTLFLDDIKTIKNVMDCTINDALIGVTSAALYRYLSRRYGGLLPEQLQIRTTMPVNIRRMLGINVLEDMMKEGSEAKWGNRLGHFVLRLPVMKCEDPLEFVRMGKAVAEKRKKSLEALFIYKLTEFIDKSLGIKVAGAFYHQIASKTTLTLSNIPGPTEEVGLCGSPLIYIAPTVYGHPQALTIHFQSYLNKMKVVLAVDELVIPDPHKLLDDMVESLQLIKDAATKLL